MTKNLFAALIGRPNVGKSTLLNQLLGEHVSIVSPKPQTTRTKITGILTKDETQYVFLDTPGVFTPRNALGEFMVRTADASVGDSDAVILMVDATAKISSVEERLIENIKKTGIPSILAGILTQLAADNDCIDVNIASGASAYQGLLAVYMAMPEEVLERGGVIFVSPAIYRSFLQDMVAINFYHYAGPQDAAPEEFILPGTDVKVVKTWGLKDSLKVVGTFFENLVYGTDGENDQEAIDIWWSLDDRVFKYQVKWASGIAYRFPNMNVLGTFAAAPVRPGPSVDYTQALAAIAENTGNIKDYSTAIGNIATAAGKLADTVNADNQLETHPNTGE